MGKKVMLSGSFMLTSIIGLLLSVIYLPQYSAKWAAAFGLIFFLMLVSSLISMSHNE